MNKAKHNDKAEYDNTLDKENNKRSISDNKKRQQSFYDKSKQTNRMITITMKMFIMRLFKIFRNMHNVLKKFSKHNTP